MASLPGNNWKYNNYDADKDKDNDIGIIRK